MPDQHSEIEVKLDASAVDRGSFLLFCASRFPDRYISIKGPDWYWQQGDNVVRHRHSEHGAGELTVKRRRSTSSTLNRLEVDLMFANGQKVEDVETFLEASGWKRSFGLFKHADIFYFDDCPVPMTIVYYKVCRIDPNERDWRYFVEIEAAKGSSATVKESMAAVDEWRHVLQKSFRLGDPVNESLWEIYTGKRGRVLREAK